MPLLRSGTDGNKDDSKDGIDLNREVNKKNTGNFLDLGGYVLLTACTVKDYG